MFGRALWAAFSGRPWLFEALLCGVVFLRMELVLFLCDREAMVFLGGDDRNSSIFGIPFIRNVSCFMFSR